MEKVFTVSEITRTVKNLLEDISVYVVGEVDSFKDGNWAATYFNLKDENSLLPCMIWKNTNVSYFPKNGDKVTVYGMLSLYEKRGEFRMTVHKIELFGEGDLLKKREELKNKLTKEGLFDESIKRKIPEFPINIGVITAATGAAVSDFITNLTKNYEGFNIFIADALVQGEKSVESILSSFEKLSKIKLDVLVLTRGGGSIEDLMSFNSEEIVRAIRACKFPVISAVGHEVDYTLSDLAADLRVSTPTKAAEYISSAYLSFRHELIKEESTQQHLFNRIIEGGKREMDFYENSLQGIWIYLKNLPDILENSKTTLESCAVKLISNFNLHVNSSFASLLALSPTAVLKRGYSLSYSESGKLVKSVSNVKIGEALRTKFHDGEVSSVIRKKLENDKPKRDNI